MVHRRLKRHRRGTQLAAEEGVVLFIVTMVMAALLVVAAFAVDFGLALVTNAKAENAVDSAALAALHDEADYTDAEIVQFARDYVSANGFDGDTADVVFPYADPEGRTCIEVRTDRDVETNFAKVISVDTIGVEARAVACRTPDGAFAPFAIVGLSQSCPTSGDGSTVWLDGSNFQITGGVHSNFDLWAKSSNGTVNGDVTYAGALTDDSSDGFDPIPTSETYAASEVLRNVPLFSDYAPGGPLAALAIAEPNVVPGWPGRYYELPNQPIDRDWMEAAGLLYQQAGSWRLAPGLYYMEHDREIFIDQSDIRNAEVTMVSNGRIWVHNSDRGFTRWDDTNGILFWSQKTTPCYDHHNPAIYLDDSNATYTGIIYAPNGFIDQHGSSNVIDGLVLGNTVWVHGSSTRVTADSAYAVPSGRTVTLTE